MSKNMCKYIEKKWGILLSILGIMNLILLMPLLCMHFPRIIDSNLGLDYMGIIIGVLSLLVTVLIGWNIYNVLTIRNEWESYKINIENKIECVANEKFKSLKECINDNKNLAVSISLAQLGNCLKFTEDFSGAFNSSMNSMAFIYEINELELNDKDTKLYNEVYEKVEKNVREILGIENLTLTPGSVDDFNLFNMAIAKTDNKELIKLFREKVKYPESDKTN